MESNFVYFNRDSEELAEVEAELVSSFCLLGPPFCYIGQDNFVFDTHWTQTDVMSMDKIFNLW